MTPPLDESAARAVEMPGHGKSGKPNCGFPLFPQPLENALRFPHSHSVDNYCSLIKNTPKGAQPQTTFTAILQAHSSMRKCWWSDRERGGTPRYLLRLGVITGECGDIGSFGVARVNHDTVAEPQRFAGLQGHTAVA